MSPSFYAICCYIGLVVVVIYRVHERSSRRPFEKDGSDTLAYVGV
jgi:hypothetical protein